MPTTLPIAEDGHNRRSAGCGRVALLRNRATPDRGVIARLFCKGRNCHDCGPRRAARYHREHLELLTAWWAAQANPVLWAFEVAPEAWSSLSKKLRRHLAAYARIPIAAGADLILTDQPTDHGVVKITTLTELQSTLAAAFTWHPGYAGDRRRPSHRGFEAEAEPVGNATGKGAGQGGDQPKQAPGVANAPGGWELLGFAGKGITLDAAVAAADALELEPTPMAERKLVADWAEAYELNLPADGTSAYYALVERLRLRAPGEHRHRGRRAYADDRLGVAA
jgi:hypothetical protein